MILSFASLTKLLFQRSSFKTPSLIAYSLRSYTGLPIASDRFKPNVDRAKKLLPVPKRIENVKRILMVTSAKGGVGKSTIAVNLALALSSMKTSVGVLDMDLHGPSVPTLLNLKGMKPELTSDGRLVPLSNYHLQCMSMGFLAPETTSVAWRGLMIMKALSQFLFQVAWDPPLDYLVLDMPPGTSDVHLSVAQQIEIEGAIVVSTPHPLSLADTVKGIDLLQQCSIPILGMVVNFAQFQCPNCTTSHRLFGTIPAAPPARVLAELPHFATSLPSLHGEAAAFQTLANEVVRQIEHTEKEKNATQARSL